MIQVSPEESLGALKEKEWSRRGNSEGDMAMEGGQNSGVKRTQPAVAGFEDGQGSWIKEGGSL